MGRADRRAELRAEGRLSGPLSAGEEARFRRPDVQEHAGPGRSADTRGCPAGDEPRELVDRLLRTVARAPEGAHAQPRSEERREGKECVSTVRLRWAP